jgi:acetyl-CoA carboxylase biotin carboxyl carrier protein
VTLTAKDVAEITRLLEESSFDELYLELDGVKLSLKRGASAGRAAVPAGSSHVARAGDTPALTASSPPGATASPPPAPIANPSSPPSTYPASTHSRSTLPAANGAELIPSAGNGADPSLFSVSSPLLGTFYRAPKPGAPPYVEVGSLVDEDTIVGILEVMKLMNTVRAGTRGRVVEILARDGTLVEYGETLLRISAPG